MLPAAHRLKRAEDFQQVFRSGTKAGTKNLVVHMLPDTQSHAPRVGFVVSKAVGNAVNRNLVKRRLRALIAGRLDTIPNGLIVIRALPSAAQANFGELAANLDIALARVQRGKTGTVGRDSRSGAATQ